MRVSKTKIRLSKLVERLNNIDGILDDKFPLSYLEGIPLPPIVIDGRKIQWEFIKGKDIIFSLLKYPRDKLDGRSKRLLDECQVDIVILEPGSTQLDFRKLAYLYSDAHD